MLTAVQHLHGWQENANTVLSCTTFLIRNIILQNLVVVHKVIVITGAWLYTNLDTLLVEKLDVTYYIINHGVSDEDRVVIKFLRQNRG